MPEKPTVEQRLTAIEHWKTGAVGSIRAWSLFLALSMGCLGWYLTYQIQNLDDNRLNVATLISSLQLLTGTVSDNRDKIEDMNKEIRDLQISNQLLSAKLSNSANRNQ